MKKLSTLILCSILIGCSTSRPSIKSNDSEKVVKAMTTEEKVRTVVGTAKYRPTPPELAPGCTNFENDTESAELLKNSVNTFMTENKVEGAAGDSYVIDELDIPAMVFADGPAGIRINPHRKNDSNSYYATAFPIATLLASTWNTELVERVGENIGNEVLEYGADILLAPGMNIHRNPLTGRNFEYYSEDPHLTGMIASAMINGIQSNGVGVSAKHFAVNNQETFRNGVNAIVSERAFREIYLKGFEIAIKKAQPWTIMSSYNKINGEYASESHKLLTEILRDEWGFQGMVMTDWWGQKDPIAQMQAGNDMLMPGTEKQVVTLIEAVESGKLSQEDLNRNTTRVLDLVKKSPAYRNYPYSNKPDLKAHAQVTREAATEGFVLLENNGALPLNKEIKTIAPFGIATYDIFTGGSGSGYVHKPYKITLKEGLQNNGYNVSEELEQTYLDYIASEKAKMGQESFWYVPIVGEMDVELTSIQKMAQNSDAALITIGRSSGEGSDRKLEGGDYYLSETEMNLIKNVSTEFKKLGKPTILILNIGGVIELTDCKDMADAMMIVWQPGQEAGNSIANVLSGKDTPSGKLPMTFAKRYSDVPSSTNFPWSDGDPSTVKYREDIFVGYRHFTTKNIEPLYEFGYGKSYTTFEYNDLMVNVNEGTVEVSVKITNTGNYSGKEIVQVYVSAPNGEVVKPVEELKAFAKTKLLAPGESETVYLTMKASDFASFVENRSAWVTDAGTHNIKVGASSTDIKLNADIEISDEIVRKVKVMFPQVSLE